MSTTGQNAAAPTPPPATAPRASTGTHGPLRVVLFGLPRAGKSALLAALAQVQQEHAAQLNGELTDSTGGLAEQRRLHYDEIPRPTDEELLPYPVRFRPPGARRANVEAWLIDSGGRVAEQMLRQPLPLDEDGASGDGPGRSLPQAVLDADALVLVIDAANPDDDVYAEFGDFLSRLEQARAERSEVTGLPVYAVLTKCDLLARRDEDVVDWIDHLEERKRRARARLQEELQETDARPREFGRLDLRLWATATKRPPLAGEPARPREPFGVAELFRQALGEAQDFRRRRARAGRRLAWATGGIGSIAFALVSLTVVLLTGLGRHEPSALQRRVEYYRLKEGTALSARLHNWPPDLEQRLIELGEIRRDPEFDDLPEDLREFVDERRPELKEYIPYLKKVLATQFPSIAHNDRELSRRRKELEERLPLPYEEWADTGAGQLRQRRLDDLDLLRRRADLAEAEFQGLRLRGIDLWTMRTPPPEGNLIEWPLWRDEAEAFLRDARHPPRAVRELPPSSLVTPSVILDFDRVRQAHRLVLSAVRDVETLRDIAFALGLMRDPAGLRPELLAIRDAADLTPEAARKRYDRLRNRPELGASVAGLLGSPGATGPLLVSATFFPNHPLVSPYPNYREAFTLAHVPDAAQAAVRQAASASYRSLLESLREQVRDRYRQTSGGGEETAAHWREVGAWLAGDPEPLRPLRHLAVVLTRLSRPTGYDPVAALADFLKKDEFPFLLRGASLTIPFDREVSPPDNAVLTVKQAGRTRTFPLKPDQTKRDPNARATTYSFEGTEQQLVYRPGDTFEVSLPLRNGKFLLWTGSRTRTYAFECLGRSPLLVDNDQGPEVARRVDDIVLQLDYNRQELPGIPEALPTVTTRPER
jgi:hypothetical protein